MKNGSYRLRVSNGFDINGKREYYNKTVSCTSKREAEKNLQNLLLLLKVDAHILRVKLL